jgi:hypothetical protein
MGLMKGNRSLVIAVGVVAVLILGWWLFGRGSGVGVVDLLERFTAAEKRPDAGLFAVEDVTLNGETKKAIAVAPAVGTRLTFKIRIPDDGWLRVSVGLKPDAWTQEGDGVRFRAIVSDGRASDELFVQDVNPFAGEEVDVMLNTNASTPGKVGDVRNDLAVWGAPEIVVR